MTAKRNHVGENNPHYKGRTKKVSFHATPQTKALCDELQRLLGFKSRGDFMEWLINEAIKREKEGRDDKATTRANGI